jgi:hypothetical protein
MFEIKITRENHDLIKLFLCGAFSFIAILSGSTSGVLLWRLREGKIYIPPPNMIGKGQWIDRKESSGQYWTYFSAITGGFATVSIVFIVFFLQILFSK